jgi:hypothetical protein
LAALLNRWRQVRPSIASFFTEDKYIAVLSINQKSIEINCERSFEMLVVAGNGLHGFSAKKAPFGALMKINNYGR